MSIVLVGGFLLFSGSRTVKHFTASEQTSHKAGTSSVPARFRTQAQPIAFSYFIRE
jgi:hypothetical protein